MSSRSVSEIKDIALRYDMENDSPFRLPDEMQLKAVSTVVVDDCRNLMFGFVDKPQTAAEASGIGCADRRAEPDAWRPALWVAGNRPAPILETEWFRILAREKVRGSEKEIPIVPIWIRTLEAFRYYFTSRVIGRTKHDLKAHKHRPTPPKVEKLVKQAMGLLSSVAAICLPKIAA